MMVHYFICCLHFGDFINPISHKQRRVHIRDERAQKHVAAVVDRRPVNLELTKGWKANIISSEITTVKEYTVLKLNFDKPLPQGYRIDNYACNNILCLRNDIRGGIWRITKLGDTLDHVYCELPKQITLSAESNYSFEWEVEQQESSTVVVKREVDSTLSPYTYFLFPLTAHCRATIQDIGSIDTIDQSFVASFLFEVRLRGISTIADVTAVEEFMKILSFENKLVVLKVKEEDSLEQYSSYFPGIKPDHYDYIMKVRTKGTFAEALELANFPIDTQKLTLTITCNRPNIVKFVENEEYPSIFMFNDFQLSSVFDVVFYEYVFGESTLSDPAESSSGYEYPRFNFTITLARKAGYYLSNVCVPMCFISMLSLISLSINQDGTYLSTGDRLGVSLTLLLTGVAYKFVVASSLPQLSYQTLLDQYVWCCFGFLILVTTENTIYPIIYNHYQDNYPEVNIENVESYITLGLGLLFVLLNLVWIGIIATMIIRQSALFDLQYSLESSKREDAKKRLK